ncbi:MAG: hypothetical protein DCC58_02245 [Chloroflexi bacterium]|nr:MAG: hypothetical protein DCC58_02245 [Chloroflexota bacterium]
MTRGSQRIGRYQVERRLGSGTFATVWLAYDPDLDTRVAVKVLGLNWSADDDVKRRFLQEARMLFRINDPRVIRVYTTGEDDNGCPYFVMDYVDRGSLEERITARSSSGQPFTPVEALATVREIADCLSVVHRVGIVHRDLKPSNALYRSDPSSPTGERLLLGDFGIARALEAGFKSTIVAGSPYYMAPEQAEETTAGLVDQRADIYAGSVILYELLSGQVPYPFRTISEIRRAQDAGQLVPLGQRRAGLPSTVLDVVERGLRVDPRDRYANVEAWIAALDSASAALVDTPSQPAQSTWVPTASLPGQSVPADGGDGESTWFEADDEELPDTPVGTASPQPIAEERSARLGAQTHRAPAGSVPLQPRRSAEPAKTSGIVTTPPADRATSRDPLEARSQLALLVLGLIVLAALGYVVVSVVR